MAAPRAKRFMAARVQTLQNLLMSFDDQVEGRRDIIRRSFNVVILLCIAAFILLGEGQEPIVLLGAAFVFVAGLAPAWMWTRRKTFGLPIIPAIAAFDVVWFGVPLLRGHSEIGHYAPDRLFTAAMTETLFLTIVAIVYFYMGRVKQRPPKKVRLMGQTKRSLNGLVHFALLGIAIGSIYAVLFMAGDWWKFANKLPGGFQRPMTSGIKLLTYLSMFLLSFSLGARLLNTRQTIFFVSLSALYSSATVLSLFISPLIPVVAALVGGYAIASGKLAWRFLLGLFLILNLLHLGKNEMRGVHWETYDHELLNVYPTGYPELFAEWFNYGLAALGEKRQAEETTKGDLIERMSLIQMLLLSQSMAPEVVSHLNGLTYTRSAGGLVPRFIWPGKPSPHEGQRIMNVHFGLQTEEQTKETYIAWGMLAEAWANFGWGGVIGLALIYGFIFSWLGRITTNVPIVSIRFVMASLFVVIGINATQSSTILWINSMFQAALLCAVGSTALLKKVRNPVYENAVTESVGGRQQTSALQQVTVTPIGS